MLHYKMVFKSKTLKAIILLLLGLFCASQASVIDDGNSDNSVDSRRGRFLDFKRLHLPYFGIGPYCNGCPDHYCDDDPAVIHGYCCGCAKLTDSLPISCPGHLQCPLDVRGLCRDYEYMMHCCC